MQSRSSSTTSRRASIFYSGSANEAIEQCKRERKLLVVFLHGLCDGESIRADAGVHHALQEHDSILALRLYDDLNNTDPLSHEDAKFFREIFPSIKSLPFLMILHPDGHPVAQLEGYEVADGVEDSLTEAISNLQGHQDGSSVHSQQTNFRDEPSPARSLDSNHSAAFKTSFPAFPEFPSFGSLGQNESKPTWMQSPTATPQTTPPMSPRFGSSNFSNSLPTFNQPAAENHKAARSPDFGDASGMQNSSSSTSSFGAGGRAMAPFPFSAPQTFGQSSSLITNFPRSQAISMAEAISRATGQAATAAAGDAFERTHQPQQTTLLSQSPSSYFSHRGMDSQIPTPMTSPKADITQDFHESSRTPAGYDQELTDMPTQHVEPQLHGSQSLGAFESRSSLPSQPSVFETSEGPAAVSEDLGASETHEPEVRSSGLSEPAGDQPLLQEEHSPGGSIPEGQEDRSLQDQILRQEGPQPMEYEFAAPEPVQQDDIREESLPSQQSAPIPNGQIPETAGLHRAVSTDSARLKRKDFLLAHGEEPTLEQSRGMSESSRGQELKPTQGAFETQPDRYSSYPNGPERPAIPPIRTSLNDGDSISDIVNKYRRARAGSPSSSPRQSDLHQSNPAQFPVAQIPSQESSYAQQNLPAPHYGSQKLSYRRSQDSTTGSPKAQQSQLEQERSGQGYYTDSSSPKSQATLANGVTDSSLTTDTAAQRLLELTAQELGTDDSDLDETPASSRAPAVFQRASHEVETLQPKSAFASASHNSSPQENEAWEALPETEKAERMRSGEAEYPPTFRYMAEPQYHSSSRDPHASVERSAENRITEADRVGQRPDTQSRSRSPKAEASRQIFQASRTESMESEGKPRHKSRSPRRSSSLRRKSVQKGYDAYGLDKENQRGETALFKGFDTASHRHTSPITSPRTSAKFNGDLPKFEIFKFTEPSYDNATLDDQEDIKKKQHEAEMQSPEKKLRLQQADVIPLPDRDTSETTKLPTQQAAVGRAGMVTIAVGNMQLYLGALLVIVLGFLSGLFSLGAKQIAHVTPDAVKDAVVQPFQLISSQAQKQSQAAKDKEPVPKEDGGQIERRRTN